MVANSVISMPSPTPVSVVLPCRRRAVGSLRLVRQTHTYQREIISDIPPKTPQRPILNLFISNNNANIQSNNSISVKNPANCCSPNFATKKVAFGNTTFALTTSQSSLSSLSLKIADENDTCKDKSDGQQTVDNFSTFYSKYKNNRKSAIIPNKHNFNLESSNQLSTNKELLKDSALSNSEMPFTASPTFLTNSAILHDIEKYQTLIKELKHTVKLLKNHPKLKSKGNKRHFIFW